MEVLRSRFHREFAEELLPIPQANLGSHYEPSASFFDHANVAAEESAHLSPDLPANSLTFILPGF
jgi:hypothetical protein